MAINDKTLYASIEEIKPKKGSIFIAHINAEGLTESNYKDYSTRVKKELKHFFRDKRFIIDYCTGSQKTLDVEVIEPTRKATKIDYLRYFFKFVCDKVRRIENGI